MLKLENVFKSYGSIKAVEDISFGVDDGKCFCIIGRSGCGKSTVLKVVALIVKPTQGKIVIDGRAVNNLNVAEIDKIRKEKIAYSFQEPLLIPYMTALENLTEITGVNRESAIELLFQLGLSNRLSHKPLKLSVGEKKRVDIARALLRGSPILVADEPLANLDPSNSLKVMGLLKAHANKGGTVVYSSVEPLDAKFADSFITM